MKAIYTARIEPDGNVKVRNLKTREEQFVAAETVPQAITQS